jgi:geranylgeranyl diphosphate synthase type II
MALPERVDAALKAALDKADTPSAPPGLVRALRYAVFPGGARVRPTLCLAVARACGDDQPAISDAAAVAVELLHCASLVHDDLPCFDNAGFRRGKPSVHAVYGEPIALLAGDALIVMAFEKLAIAGAAQPSRIAPLIEAIARGVGAPAGIVAGQAWESEPSAPLDIYHQAKTGALFVAATTSGAIAAGADGAPWRALGETLGTAYQVADDLLDALQSDPSQCDKPVGQDALLRRPSVVAERGIQGALDRLYALVEQAVDSVPACDGAQEMRDLVRRTAMRLAPKQLTRSAA